MKQFVSTICCLAALLFAHAAAAQSTLIPLTSRRGMVFDHSGQYLYISTSDGVVQRYSLTSGQLETAYTLGGSLNGIDIAPDDSFLVVAQNQVNGSQGSFHKIDLRTGVVTTISYSCSFGEAGGWDVAIAANGLTFVTTQFNGSGSTPLRQIDGAGNVSIRSDLNAYWGTEVQGGTQIHRSADAARLYFTEPNNSGGPFFSYDAASNRFSQRGQAQMYLSTASAAVNRDGSLVATLTGIQYPFNVSDPHIAVDTATDFHFVRAFRLGDAGVAFDAVSDTMYVVSSTMSEIIAYDTKTYEERLRLDLGEVMPKMITPFGVGTLVASNDGRFVALATPAGIRVFDVATGGPPNPPVPALADRRDMVFDHAGRFLFVSTGTGLIERYELATGNLAVVADLGGKLNGLDIAADDSFLVVAQDYVGVLQGMFQKIDLSTGAVTNLTYTRGSSEAGASAVAITTNGRAFLTTHEPAGFSAFMPLRQLDLTSGLITPRTDAPGTQVSGNTMIRRSADGNHLYFLEPNDSAGPVFTYDARADQFGPVVYSGMFLDGASAAVSRDGGLIATRTAYRSSVDTLPDFHFVEPLNSDGGVAFDAVKDIVYTVHAKTADIVAYDSNTFVEQFRIAAGAGIPRFGSLSPELGDHKLVSSNDGRYVALETASGVRIFTPPASASPPRPPPAPLFSTPRRVVFDHSGQYLYIGTANGVVWPYNLGTEQLESPITVGGSLNGMDIARDDSYLIVAQALTGITEGRFEKLDLRTRAKTKYTYRGEGGEAAWDVAIAANDTALISTTVPQASGWWPLRQINLADGTVKVRSDAPFLLPGKVRGESEFAASGDGTIIFVHEPDGTRPLVWFDGSSNSFASYTASDVSSFSVCAVNRDGSTVPVSSGGWNAAISLRLLPNFAVSHTFALTDFDFRYSQAVAFDPTADIVIGVKPTSATLVSYSTADFTEISEIPVPPAALTMAMEGKTAGQMQLKTLTMSSDRKHIGLFSPTAITIVNTTTGMSRAITALPRLANISTRAVVQPGDGAPIAGFIITGTKPKEVIIRAIGPSLAASAVSNALADPKLELHDHTGAIIFSNDNWSDTQRSDIEATGIAPSDSREAAILATLQPGAYTAVVRGHDNESGVAVVELYDLQADPDSKLANISTRGYVGAGDDAMIAGVIIQFDGVYAVPPTRKVLLRGIGPSLAEQNVSNPLSYLTLQLYDGNGTTMALNDHWGAIQGAAITALGLAPSDAREAAILTELPPGNYTAVLRGKNGTGGVGLVEAYSLE
jgi:hypothetical protein